ncbi:hormogonium polysaccharide biosynthesis glycosyltransferase HpsE [Mastigocoleus testarum]|uniref:Glycosyl transferase n=1 Tax=Mastigocoleus testarum BC008 TaxID=371196 RepID=A0A0V7ZIQ5_9CYAN|nr:hormogonium polysaccharide biosynthesis glycosyltransferase HpsE [Mastigocoleus testarum]KST64317.1 glycosyl transferase [Mastigocoleus testarum BC008]KST64370.1 glycosyl transferase [Mastigocoleus testarum BC008]
MSLDLTIAITTYNGEKRLPQVLEKLKNQIDTKNIKWEVLIVDNNSTDNTAKIIREYQVNWLKNVPLRYCFESQQGVQFARKKAISEAKGDLIGFIDDDNLPYSNWVKAACEFAKKNPKAGAFSSRIHGLFETEPSEELKKIIFYLAIVDRGVEPMLYEPRQKGLPPGAGLVVRREVWEKYVPSRLLLVSRSGNSIMAGGEDAEVLLHIYRAGWEIWYNPTMEIDHLIPSWRLEKTYLTQLMRSIGLGRFHLRMLLLQWWERPIAFVFYLINDLCKIIIHFIANICPRLFPNIQDFISINCENNIVNICEMERLIGTFFSPFHLAKFKFKELIFNKNV